MKPAVRLATFLLALLGAASSQAQPALQSPSPELPAAQDYVAAQARWKSEFAGFANADKEHPPAEGGVLFVGSSTIRLWNSLADDFRQLPVVINRGFGGSTMHDCSLFARDLVVRYKPRHVLVYAGDNDLAEGRTPMQVLESFARFTGKVRTELPEVRISYISIKPSPSRERLMPKIRETNHMVDAYLQRLPNSEYVDIFTPMLGEDGLPRAELFRGDRLHLNEKGYRLWKSIISALFQTPLPVVGHEGAAPAGPGG